MFTVVFKRECHLKNLIAYLMVSLVFIMCLNSNASPHKDVQKLSNGTSTQKNTYYGLVKTNGTVKIHALGDGVIVKRNYEMGDLVESGDAIYELNSALQESELRLANERLNRSRILLKSANIELVRLNPLHSSGQISISEFEKQSAAVDEAVAAVSVNLAEVEVAQQKINDRKVLAPFSGRLGIIHYDVGEYVTPESTLSSVSTLKDSFIDIDLPYSDYVKIGDDLQDKSRFSVKVGTHTETVAIKEIGGDKYLNERTKTVTIRLVIQTSREVLSGTLATIEFTSSHHSSSPVVSHEVIDKYVRQNFATIVRGGRVEKVEVQYRCDRPDQCVIIEGLNLGDSLIIEDMENVDVNSTLKKQSAE